MDEIPPKTPMTPGVGPRFGMEEETSFAGNTAPTVVSSEGTSTVAERLWRAKVQKKLQKKAWNRYWKKDKFCDQCALTGMLLFHMYISLLLYLNKLAQKEQLADHLIFL